jgi:hypothetical protein
LLGGAHLLTQKLADSNGEPLAYLRSAGCCVHLLPSRAHISFCRTSNWSSPGGGSSSSGCTQRRQAAKISRMCNVQVGPECGSTRHTSTTS